MALLGCLALGSLQPIYGQNQTAKGAPKGELEVSVGYTSLKRETENMPILRNAAGANVQDSDDLDTDREGGIDLSVKKTQPSGGGVQYRWLDPEEWSATHGATGTNFVFRDFPNGAFGPALPVTSTFRSDLSSHEVNLFCNSCFFAGFRYISLDEELEARISPINAHNWSTENDLFGFQLGTDAVLWKCSRLSISGIGKVGLFYNDIETRYLETGANFNAGNRALGTSEEGDLTTVVELGLTADFEVTNRFSVFGGYQLLFLEGVGTATDQVGQSSAPPGGALAPATSNLPISTGIDTNGTLFSHGFIVGGKIIF